MTAKMDAVPPPKLCPTTTSLYSWKETGTSIRQQQRRRLNHCCVQMWQPDWLMRMRVGGRYPLQSFAHQVLEYIQWIWCTYHETLSLPRCLPAILDTLDPHSPPCIRFHFMFRNRKMSRRWRPPTYTHHPSPAARVSACPRKESEPSGKGNSRVRW